MSSRGVLVTVGTTSFDGLVEAATSEAFAEQLEAMGYAWLRVQVGRGKAPEEKWDTRRPLRRSWFRMTPDMPGEMGNAALIVSHGGAGSIMEALTLKKRLIVCVNTALMGNHQEELAVALRDRRHLVLCDSPSDLVSAVASSAEVDPYPDYDPEVFPNLVNDEMRRRDYSCSVS